MKKFFMVTPQQSPENLHEVDYAAQGNQRLVCDPARFPVIPLVNGFVERGDKIQVITRTPKLKNCASNLQALVDDLAAMAEKKGFEFEVISIDVPFSNSPEDATADFLKLIDHVEDDDIVYADITFGTKPMTVANMMALNYAFRVRRNVSIGCVVYGEVDWTDKTKGRIYDETSLIKLDEIVRRMADLEVENPKEFLRDFIDA